MYLLVPMWLARWRQRRAEAALDAAQAALDAAQASDLRHRIAAIVRPAP